MKSVLKGLGVASVLALSAGAAHADPMMMAQSYAACNTQYGQCLAAADYTIASTPEAGLAKLSANSMHATECASALQACYASVK
ncbi:MAG: hypothetical protein KDJ90_16180 [Nitratireductor sp.]|nr:hypothetical protein [Nitratireductor sp.]